MQDPLMTSSTEVNATPSNMCGVTLMNTRTGYIVAELMEDRDGVTVSEYPSMIRVDAVNRVEFDFDEITEAVGQEFRQPDFEEIMSTHYGRMVVDDDTENVILFANPEDAAAYIGFDLPVVE